QAPGVDVLAAERVALEIGSTNARDAELVELVELADAGEGDAVVDLRDLAKGVRRVLRADHHPALVHDGDEASTAGDALAGVVGPVLHHLLGCDVEGHAHEAPPEMRSAYRSASSLSGTRVNPSASMVATTGQMPRAGSGPPV